MSDDQKRREIEESVHVLSEIFHDGLMIVSDQGEIKFSNSKVEQMTLYSKEELEGQNISILVGSSMRERHEELVRTLSTSGKVDYESKPRYRQLTRKDGKEMLVSVIISRYQKNGTHNFIVSIRNENATENQLGFLEYLLEYIPAMAVIKDLEDNIKYTNTSFSDKINTIKLENQDISIGVEMSKIFHDSDEWVRSIIRTKDGDDIDVAWYNMPLNSLTIALGILVSDISSDEKILRQALQVVIDRKELSNREALHGGRTDTSPNRSN